MTTKKQCSARLRNSADRLSLLVELNAPKIILANEVSLILECALAVCGEELRRMFGMDCSYEKEFDNGERQRF